MSEFPLLAVTDAACCPRPLPEQIKRLTVCNARPSAVILRAKELNNADYCILAKHALQICTEHKLPLIVHSDWQLTQELGIKRLHLPLARLHQLPQSARKNFSWLSTSVHSVEEALEAQSLGATALVAGHIYATQCKSGLAPRGLEFLKAVCAAVQLPVYAIGGIGFDAAQHCALKENGARGACVMSAYMKI